MARHSRIGLLFIFMALIALLFVFVTLIMPMPAFAQSLLKTKTRVDVASATTVFGEPVTFTATVSPIGRWPGTSPVGVVSFEDLSSDKSLGTASLGAGGTASVVVTDLAIGTHAIKATFLGSIGQDGSSGRVTVAVSPAARRDYIVLGADLGSLVIVQDARTRDEVFRFDAFPGFTGGVSVAAGDLTGDSVPDIVVGTGVGGGSLVGLFDGVTHAPLGMFLAFPGSNGPIAVASGDVTGDGRADVIVGAPENGQVKVFDGVTGTLVRNFSAFAGVSGGVSLAAGDINGDGAADVMVGAPVNGQVKVFDGATNVLLRSFFAYQGFAGGVYVAAGDINGDGVSEILTGPSSVATQVKAFDGATLALRAGFLAYAGAPYGVRVAAAAVNGDGVDDILTAPAAPIGNVKIFDGASLALLESSLAVNLPAGAGLYVTGSR
jgi:hypothetical protein